VASGARAARVIPEFFWHKSQVIEPVPGEPGTIDFTLRIAINPRFVGWIGERLREIAVLEPASLRETSSNRATFVSRTKSASGASGTRLSRH
jgi:hypothetical protein